MQGQPRGQLRVNDVTSGNYTANFRSVIEMDLYFRLCIFIQQVNLLLFTYFETIFNIIPDYPPKFQCLRRQVNVIKTTFFALSTMI